MNASRTALGLFTALALAHCSVDRADHRYGTGGMGADAGSSGEAGEPALGGRTSAGGTAGSAGEIGSAGESNAGSAGQASGGNAGAGAGGSDNGASGAGAGGEAGSTSVPEGFCASRTRPSGVATTDYECITFEPGLPSSTAWKPTTANSASAMLSTTRAVSLPNSWLASVPAVAAMQQPGEASLLHHFVGAQQIKSIVVSANISLIAKVGVTPAWTGSVDLLCVDSGSGNTCLSYTEGGSTESVSDYSGLYLTHVYTGGPAYLRTCQVSGSIATGVWTRVELHADTSGSVTLLLDGTNHAASDCDFTYLVDSAADVQVGLAAHSATARPLSAYYDNVEAYVTR